MTNTAPVELPIVDHSRRNQRVIWLLLAAAFVVILNETIMSVAIPRLMSDLSIDARAAQWLTTAFMLTMAVVIPITGFLLQRYNTRPIFIAAMTLFSAGTLLAAVSPDFEVLLVARVVQASGTAIMMPLLMTTIMTLVPPATRGKTMGNVSIVMSVAPALGPTISGLILSTLTWRWLFWLVLPIALVMLVIGIRRVENVSEPRPVPIDVVSVILSAFAFGGLVYGLSLVGASAQQKGDAIAVSETQMWVSLAVGALALAIFIWRQLLLQRQDRALLDLRTFRSPIFTASVSILTVSMVALFGTIVVFPLYLQRVLGLTELESGLMIMPGALLMGLLAPFIGRLYDRIGPKPLVIPGTMIVSGVLWGFTTVGTTTSVWFVLALQITLNLGLGMLFTPLFTAGLGAVRPSLYSHASAVVGTIQQVAGAAGIALLVTVMSTHAAALEATGVSVVEAEAAGTRAAFLVGAIISLAGVALSFFIKKPADVIAEAPVPATH
jgi:MFS transporter, DHA2 family, lincomycin resistance protein